ncbi:hypothetical protein M758_3G153200 [Ceratodon purpureus]|nr:hypothetical protein M758_3G153200 [Ceratodon purpureus]
MHTYKSGNRYEGEWKFGKKNGHGTFWIKSGKYYIRKYRGSWKDNQYGGTGCFYGFGGERYNGQWEKGKRHGLGTQTYRDWNAKGEVYHKYHGNWVNGKREGMGHLTMSNGNVYQGEWKNDWKEGMGVFYYKDKQSKYEGLWRDDIAVSGVYSRNTNPGQLEIPFVMLPDAKASNQKFLKLAASRPPPPRYDRTKRRTDPQLCTRKFYNVLYGSPLLDTGRPL